MYLMSVTISVVTPSVNAQNMVAETFGSIVKQSAFISGRAKLQYILQDGGSRDNTVRQAIEAGRGIIDVRSSNDRGMYDARAHFLTIDTQDFEWQVLDGATGRRNRAVRR
jgi:glycosyltransferase involved in cell wall biosynthesis